jgi:hypothetical protein
MLKGEVKYGGRDFHQLVGQASVPAQGIRWKKVKKLKNFLFIGDGSLIGGCPAQCILLLGVFTETSLNSTNMSEISLRLP